MTPDEREELEAVRLSGAAGKREGVVEAAARRSEDARERRPPEYLEPPTALSHRWPPRGGEPARYEVAFLRAGTSVA
jgi:hypothetical protein